MAERIAIGLIGCGFFAQNHMHAWTDLAPEGADLVAVCDIDPAKANAAAEKFGARAYTDASEMLGREKLGLVDIATGQATHLPMVELALSHRVPTIVQKPFGQDMAEVRRMVELSRATGTFLAVHENFRFQLPQLKINEIIRSGAIGTPTWARISFRTGYDIYTGQPYLARQARFVLIDLGVHVLDVARFHLGEVEHLTAELQRRNPDAIGEDTATMLLRHTSGAVSMVECTYGSRRIPDSFPETLVEIEGDKGAIITRIGSRLEVTSNGRMEEIDADPAVLPWAERPWHVAQDSVLRTNREMLQAVQQGRPAATSAEDNARTFALVEAAYLKGQVRPLA
ncbi:MAG TPA: Gfo/Idh/MocA family oxidoreductase [Devosia sp.]|nr:Gfo/Idh/MocA family oxidoreductase [Devosia sp.]